MSKYKIVKNDYKNLNKNIHIVIISSEFNRELTKSLEDINEKFLLENGFKNIKKFLVPGAFEIPGFLKKIIKNTEPDLVICFGVVIRGETTHYEMVAGESARGIMDISIKSKNTSIINGILTCENEEQVKSRISNTYALSGLNLLNEVNKI
ncbi:MAG: 6,7-dimethyl-8-ribityllumazine synthase [Candidatus Gracilibacteria bacterium]|nr:6,7-dimethyl-8-ribityllumazine synthase [Candidatus Gracilibacteria bacterium]